VTRVWIQIDLHTDEVRILRTAGAPCAFCGLAVIPPTCRDHGYCSIRRADAPRYPQSTGPTTTANEITINGGESVDG